MTKYVFDDEGIIPIKNAKDADPQVIGDALSKISVDGRLTPDAVVEAASAPRHPLHKFFEWDDAKAAHSFRMEQARTIIRIVRVEDDGEPKRAFLSVNDGNGVAYHSLGAVQVSRDLQLLVLKQAERDLDAFQQRYRDLRDICDMVRPAAEVVKSRRKQAETRGAP